MQELYRQTALYSTLDVEYAQEMSGPYEDLSFRSDECVVIAGLKNDRITGFWRPMIATGSDELLLSQIERLYKICPRIVYMDFLLDGELSIISKFLLDKGHTAKLHCTQIIDLTKTEMELRVDLRKSYKSLVNKTPTISLLCDIAPLMKLHRQVKGVTRSDESWHIQRKMLWQKEGFALLQTRFLKNNDPSFENTISEAGVFIYYNNFTAYYGVGCSLEGVDSHAILWSAILHAKKLGCKTFEMGEQIWSGETKLVNIAKYKRGFGGFTKARLILEKEVK